MRTLILVGLVALSFGSGLGYWLASRVAEARELEVSLRYAEGWLKAVNEQNEANQLELERALSQIQKRAITARRSDDVIHETIADSDVSCEWRPEHRMRIETLYDIYSFPHKAASFGVSNEVR